MSAKSNPKLTIELIPSTCHYSNVRTTVKPTEWDKIRFISYEAAGNVCELCGDTGKNQGYKHNVECHEIWEYDDVNHVQRLAGLISLCPTCHQVKHIGRAVAIGKEKQAHAQLRKVNAWSQEQVVEHVDASFVTYKERSKHEWTLDLTILTDEPYSLEIDSSKKRKFVKKKFKRKRKKKPNLAVKRTVKAKRKKRSNKRPPRYK